MRAIFISYRREDAEGQAGRLFHDLTEHFGEDAVFMDVAGIAPGRDFRRVIDEHVASCGVLLAMIGKSWIDATDECGRRRLEDPADFVRLETASALKRDIPVVPVLVHGARMPRPEQLPEDLTELAYRNSVELTHARWDSDVQVLIKALSPYAESLQKNGRTDNALPAETPSTRVAGDLLSSDAPGGSSGNVPLAAIPAIKKSFATLVAGTAAALVIGVSGYLWYQVSSERAQMARHAALLEETKKKIAAEELKAKQRIEEKAIADSLEAKKQAVDKALVAETEAKRRAQERVLAQDMEAKRQAQERAYAQELEAKKRSQEIAEAEKHRAEKRAEEIAIAEKREAERQAREHALEERERVRIARERAAAAQRARWPSYNFPPPNGGLLVYTILPDGHPACASYNASGCLWGVNYDQLDFRRMRPLACGPEHRARWGKTGYEDPKHWCSLARSMAAYRR